MRVRKDNIDMTIGSALKNIISFSLPLMVSGVLQIFYNIADKIVAGRCIGSNALSSVGATGAIYAMIIGFVLGLSTGVNVLVSKCYGAKDTEALKKANNSAVAMALISGFVLLCLGEVVSRPLLELMGTPGEIIGDSTLYLRIVFLGFPAIMLSNFCSAILRGVGNTKISMYAGIVSGAINVILNFVFVVWFYMGVAGIALVTLISNVVSAFILLIYLMKSCETEYKLVIGEIKAYPSEVKNIFSIGMPAAVQNILSAVSVAFIQSAINSFGGDVIAGQSAAESMENIVMIANRAFATACIVAIGQNYGAKNEKRIIRYIYTSLMCVTVWGLVSGILAYVFARPFLGMFIVDSPNAIEMGVLYIKYVVVLGFICNIMDILIGAMQGIGHSKKSLACSLIGICGGRFVWVFMVLPLFRYVEVLFLSWLVCRVVVIIMHLVLFKLVWRKSMLKMREN